MRAAEVLANTVATSAEHDVRAARRAIHGAVEKLVMATATDGDAKGKSALSRIILDHEHVRALKDRKWFAPFGFDSL